MQLLFVGVFFSQCSVIYQIKSRADDKTAFSLSLHVHLIWICGIYLRSFVFVLLYKMKTIICADFLLEIKIGV